MVPSTDEVLEGRKGMTSASNGVSFTTSSSPMEAIRASVQPQWSPQTSSPLYEYSRGR